MKTLFVFISTFIAVCFCLSCGEGNPSSPTAPAQSSPSFSSGPLSPASSEAGAILTLVSGETQAPAVGAEVKVGGKTYRSDGEGHVMLPIANLNTNLEIQAEGFLVRKTRLRSPGHERLTLWPQLSPTGLNAELTRQLVYTFVWESEAPGKSPLIRPATDYGIYVVPVPEIRANVKAMRAVEKSVKAMKKALGPGVIYEVARDAPPGSMTIDITVDAAATTSTYLANWSIYWSAYRLTGAEIIFRSVRDVEKFGASLTHCLGHTFGLSHSPDPIDMMCADWWERKPNDFSLRETLIMRLMMQRFPGTRFPDNDRSATVTASRGSFAGSCLGRLSP